MDKPFPGATESQQRTDEPEIPELRADPFASIPSNNPCKNRTMPVKLKISSIEPKFGDNYKAGYVGFTYQNISVACKGIAYMTRWARMSDIKVSHALLVTGENECIEARTQHGVVRSDLKKYFDNPHCQIFFRKPVALTAEIASKMNAVAGKEVGKKYDFNLIAAQALQGILVGKFVNTVFNGSPDRLVSKLLNNDDKWICSELVAYCLNEQPEYRDKGVLHSPTDTIDPQELFEDSVIFTPWNKS
ncbi:MAG TPA: hypothetical protein VI457_06445 [Methylococcaceae bacterium]|nr:hypothetical protein [Methylococcaceae bacterium]